MKFEEQNGTQFDCIKNRFDKRRSSCHLTRREMNDTVRGTGTL